ncbi:tape measure protein [Caloramator sp. CAR-1]|uniref:tape measure protein n=1 Tax=Caloramator sp. CAR-1 TaxID=3062777 RepID=UPI0026E2CFC6|nr:tape measure protein [Caloramator sp. CAR-1]MDO6355108.1 tape measure protein [Caloramator sp. CAR-1]
MKVGELLVAMGVDFSQYEKDLDRAEKRAQKTGLNIGDIFKNAMSFTLGMGIFEAVKSGFKAIAGSALDFNSMMERAAIGFTTMLGSAQKAQDFLDKMGKFASSTPFEYPDLLDASQRLMAMGFSADEVLPTLKAVGDAMAGMGKGANEINGVIYALGQMRMAGRVNAQDMMQLVNQGIPAWQILAEAMGKTTAEVRKMSEQGLIPADYAVNVLINGMEKRFPNMMKNMENTWQGVTSTIKDVWRMTIGAMTQGLFKGITGWLQKVRDFAQEFYSAFQQGGIENAIRKMFGPNVLSDFQMVSSALRSIWQIIVGVFNTIKNNWNIFGQIIKGVLLYFASFKLATIAVNAATKAVALFRAINLALVGESTITSGIIALLSRAVGIYKVQLKLAAMEGVTLTGVLAKLRVAIFSVWTALGPVGWAVLAISALIVAGIALYKNWDKVRYYGLQAWGALKIGILYAAYGIVSAFKFILGWIPALGNAFSSMQQALAGYIAREKSILAQRASAFSKDDSDVKAAQKLVDNQKNIADASKNAASGLSEQADATKKAGKATQDNLQSFDEVHQIMQETADASENLPEVALPNVEMPETGNLVTALSAGIGDLTSGIADKLSSVWDTIKSKAETVWNSLSTFFSNTWNGIKNTAETIWNSIANFFTNVWQRIYAAAPQFWDALGNYLRTLWQGWVSIARSIWNAIFTIFQSTWQTIYTVAVNIWNMISAFLRGDWEGIRQAAVNIWNAISNHIATVWNAIRNVITTVWQAIANNLTAGWQLFLVTTQTIWNGIKLVFDTVWNGIKTTITTVWTGIQTFLITAWTTFTTVVQTTWNAIKNVFLTVWNLIKSIFTTTWNAIESFLTTAWSTLENTANTVWNAIKNFIVNPIQSAKNTLTTLWNDISKFISNAWNNIKQGFISTYNAMKQAIIRPFEDAWNYISSIFSRAYEWGRNLVQNITNGIQSAISSIGNAAKNAANKIADFLGFHSPAKEGPGADADKWMPNMMDMLAQGIYGNISKVRNAVAEAAGVLSGITAQPEIAFGISGSVTGYKAATQVYTAPVTQPQIHLHIGTLIADDYGLKKLEQKLREIRIYEDQRLGSDKR